MNFFTFSPGKLRNERLVSFFNILIAIICITYLFSEVYYIIKLTSIHKTDMSLYFRTSSNILHGQIPFKDFRLEYPIFAIFPIMIPAFLNLLFGSSFESYCILFSLQNIGFGIIAAIFLGKTSIGESNRSTIKPMYWVLIVVSLPIYLFRYDAFLALLTALFVYLMLNRPFLAGLVLMLAIEAKLYPIIFLPVLVLFYITRLEYRTLFKFMIGTGLTLLTTLVVVLPITGLSFFDFIRYHQDRGIQLESIVAGFLMLLNQFDLIDIRLANGYGSFNIDTNYSSLILQTISLVTPVIFVLLLLFLGRGFMSEQRSYGSVRPIMLIRAFGAITLIFLLLNKVLSPQYVIWLFPFIPFYENRIRIKFIIIVMLTISIYPGWYHYLQSFHPIGVIMVNLRTVLMIWMLVDLLKFFALTNIQKNRKLSETTGLRG